MRSTSTDLVASTRVSESGLTRNDYSVSSYTSGIPAPASRGSRESVPINAVLISRRRCCPSSSHCHVERVAVAAAPSAPWFSAAAAGLGRAAVAAAVHAAPSTAAPAASAAVAARCCAASEHVAAAVRAACTSGASSLVPSARCVLAPGPASRRAARPGRPATAARLRGSSTVTCFGARTSAKTGARSAHAMPSTAKSAVRRCRRANASSIQDVASVNAHCCPAQDDCCCSVRALQCPRRCEPIRCRAAIHCAYSPTLPPSPGAAASRRHG